jgi:hypothetical protein
LTIDAMGFEASGHPCASLYPFTASTILSLPPSLHMKKERGAERGERKRRKIGKKYQDLEGVAFPSSKSHGGAGLDFFHHYARPPAKTHEAWVLGGDRAQSLPCARGSCVPAPAERYVVSFVAFYERGFGTPPHRFLHSLLRYYGLRLHHLTPSGVLHIAALMTLGEAYLGIDLELDLWKYFFHVQRL